MIFYIHAFVVMRYLAVVRFFNYIFNGFLFNAYKLVEMTRVNKQIRIFFEQKI